MQGIVDRNEGLAYADSPTNLLWRMQNDFQKKSASTAASIADESDDASFTEFTLDVKH